MIRTKDVWDREVRESFLRGNEPSKGKHRYIILTTSQCEHYAVGLQWQEPASLNKYRTCTGRYMTCNECRLTGFGLERALFCSSNS